MLRTVVLIVLGLATAAWVSLLALTFAHFGTTVTHFSTNFGVSIGITFAATYSATFLVFALPAFILALKRKLLGLALTLALLSLIALVLVA